MRHFVPKNKENERGAVLLTTLLVMAIMAALAVALMDDVRLALKRTSNISDYSQADWYVRGAEDYVADVLAQRLQSIDAADRNQIVAAMNPIMLPLENGLMQLNVWDGSHCFNLNSLTTAQGEKVEAAEQQFIDFLEALGVPSNETEPLKARLIDWVDADSQSEAGGAEDGDYLRRTPASLPPNTNMASVMEIRAIEGVTPEIYEAIRPWLCIGEPHVLSEFNIDLAEPWQAPLLASYMGGIEHLSLALQLIQDRPPQGYRDFNTLQDHPALTDTTLDSPLWSEDQIIFEPKSLWVELTLSYRKVQRLRSFHFTGVDNGRPILTYRGWGRESFRPSLRPEENPVVESR